ncbi:hypothetical protein NDA11_005404 [Ustilago hordei]|uniref:Reverse transcriptase Ty1/copia-type domain-containing protein n=1 Tax=Ustilago hordei TaxID=120017 RepID=I2FW28_USTHO|nr:hypothetical protein NDA10_000058 [Ustilago hordei]KAJ1570902.1 hypothetical protein NDA11_005404 [Ustilago hordei]KAJ1587292.1 hypothetical protein NDA15_004140 [Ustilago hordei]KAJ1589944.1 hypothetical protein NDA12_002363 [Ustilago hordei]KAJ1602038.1 hypothetical protein NDA14_000917 [Ustilago hordei]
MESPNCQDLLSYMAFAATCVETHASTISNHHLNHMVFATTVMDGTALVASSQQICNADGILLEPLSLSEAKARDDWNKWYEAMVTEMASMTKMDVFELADIPTDDKLIGVCWVFKLKLDGQQRATWYKACLVTQGYAQHQGLDYNQTFSPVVHLQAIYMLLTLAHQYSLYVIQLDINTVFLNGRIDKDVYVWIPPLFEAKVTEGSVSHIIGLSVHYEHEKCTLSIDQSGYIEGVLEKFGMSEAWLASTPVTEPINSLKPQEGEVASAEEVCHYASLVGSLLWIAQGSRPDITFAIGRCAWFVANLSGEHLTAAKCILRYLKETIQVSLSATGPVGGQILTGWADSDWAGSRECRRSTSRYVFTIDRLVCVMGLDVQKAGRSSKSYEGSVGIKESGRSWDLQ